MASDVKVDGIFIGSELLVQIEEAYDEILTITTKKKAMKGFLMSVSHKNNVIFDKLLSDYQELNEKLYNQKSCNENFCIPDSTLTQNASENNISGTICTLCKESINKLPKLRKISKLNTNLNQFKNHGFNKDTFKKKIDASRRSILQENDKEIDKSSVKKSVNTNKVINTQSINNKDLMSTNFDLVYPTRKTFDRVLKTKANEKIIDLCSKRKSDEVNIYKTVTQKKVKESLFLFGVSNEKKDKNATPLISDASVYDFNDPESANLSNDFSKDRHQVTNDRSFRSSTLSVTFYESDGEKFFLNDLVWAKLPGYPFWPAHIHAFVNVSKKIGRRCRIHWIGWNKISVLPLKSLVHFRECFIAKYSPKIKSFIYKNAIFLACKELGLDMEKLVTEALLDAGNRTPDKGSGSGSSFSKKKSLDLDEIFRCEGGLSRNLAESQGYQKSCSEDEDTDEEEKARSALITIESLEADTKLSGLISRID